MECVVKKIYLDVKWQYYNNKDWSCMSIWDQVDMLSFANACASNGEN